VGKLSLYDGQNFELSNINRVYGSSVFDEGTPKVRMLSRLAHDIGLGTSIQAFGKPITDKETAMSLRDADIIFGCTDDEWGRSILNGLALRYAIPVIDTSAKIDSAQGVIKHVLGRVTILMPGAACLLCRNRISADNIKNECDRVFRPSEAAELRKEGYAPELPDPDPAVIPFTTAVASMAVTEMIHRLTGFMGDDRVSTEVLHFFEQSEIHSNATSPAEGCICTQKTIIGRGDQRDFLGMTWP